MEESGQGKGQILRERDVEGLQISTSAVCYFLSLFGNNEDPAPAGAGMLIL